MLELSHESMYGGCRVSNRLGPSDERGTIVFLPRAWNKTKRREKKKTIESL